MALTGGIATGKTYVLEQLRLRGVPCVDADEIAHGVTTAGTEATSTIANRFGADVIDASGAVDRQKLAAIVFADASARRDLEAIVHPAVYRAIEAALRAFERVGDYPLAVAAIPLLYETGRESDFDRVIATTCAEQTQLSRLVARGLTEAEAQQRLAAQWSAADKAARADDAINTDGTRDETNAQLDRILRVLVIGQ